MKILITGSSGQLGEQFKKQSLNSRHDLIFVDRSSLDITDRDGLVNYFENHKVDLIVNCAAYTSVDKAETEKEMSYLVNQTGVKNLVNICKDFQIALIHFSTDYVFDGLSNRAYKENDDTNPQSVYGASKLAGEEEILKSSISAVIIRTSWLYSKHGRKFYTTMLA